MALDESVSEISTSSSSTSSPNTSLDVLMKLLRGKTDSERLAGLLLVTKLCDPNDQNAILNVYHAIGSTFIHRILLTGAGKIDGGDGGRDANREAYLGLAVAVLATFARIPEVASTDEMLSIVPVVVEVLSKESISPIFEDCYEFLFLVSNAKMDGVVALYDSGMMRVLAHQISALNNDSRAMELALKLVQLIVVKMPGERVYADHLYDLSNMVPVIAKKFAILHCALKFDALHLLSAIFSSNYSGALHETLRSRATEDWPTYARVGIVDVLQNRVGPAERLKALCVADATISIVGEEWLLGKTILPDTLRSFPVDRCILLVLESSRVEIAVLLNELAYLKYETSSPPNCEDFLVKLKNLGVAFSLVEKIIKCLSIFGENEESNTIIGESTSIMIIKGLDETIGVVLDYLQDAKDHGKRRGDDLLASVRIVGSYLAEAPSACEERVKELLGYMLTVEGQDQSSASYCISFLLPMMAQITMSDGGCRIFASAGGFAAVSGYLVSLIDSKGSSTEGSTIILACDTILNFLLKREKDTFSLDGSFLIKLLQVLSHWAENSMEPTVVMMASSICSLILKSTSEDALVGHPDFKIDDLHTLSRLMKRCLVSFGQDPISHDPNSGDDDLYQIVASGYSSWSERFPHIKEAVER